MTGVPSYERLHAVESVIREKDFEYYVYVSNSQSSLREILSDLCNWLCVCEAFLVNE